MFHQQPLASLCRLWSLPQPSGTRRKRSGDVQRHVTIAKELIYSPVAHGRALRRAYCLFPHRRSRVLREAQRVEICRVEAKLHLHRRREPVKSVDFANDMRVKRIDVDAWHSLQAQKLRLVL